MRHEVVYMINGEVLTDSFIHPACPAVADGDLVFFQFSARRRTYAKGTWIKHASFAADQDGQPLPDSV